MHFAAHYRGHKGSQNFRFDDNGQWYLVSASADGSMLTLKSHFFRTTRNVFGNGSSNVEQSGWRTLRTNGRTYRRVLAAFVDFLRAAAAARTLPPRIAKEYKPASALPAASNFELRSPNK